MFSGHYHPQLLSSTSHPHHTHQPSLSKKRHRDSDSIVSEEEEEIARHQGTPSEKSRSGGGLLGRHTWEQRWKALSQRIVSFDPKSQQRLSFAGASSCTPSPDSPLAHGDGDSVKRGRRKHERAKASSGGIEKERKDVKMWYEGPSVAAVGDMTFELPFITNLMVHTQHLYHQETRATVHLICVKYTESMAINITIVLIYLHMNTE